MSVSDDADLRFPETSFSIQLWMKAANSHIDISGIVRKATIDSNDVVGYRVALLNNNKVNFLLGSGSIIGGQALQAVTDSDLTDGEWHLISCVCDRSNDTISIYVDGEIEDTTDISAIGSISNTEQLTLIPANVTGFSLGTVGIYDTAITEQQIQDFLACNLVAEHLEVTSPEHGFVDEDLVTLFGIVRIDGTSFDGVYEIADATGDTFKLKDIETNEYIDGSLLGEYDETATVIPVAKEIEGLGHLEGRTVAILADGVVHDQLEVESGEITLDDYYNTVIVGLPYESEFRSLPVSLLTQSGTSRGWLKKTKRIYLEFIRSLGAVYGAPDGDLRPIRFAPYTDAQDGTEPFTGLQELPLLAGFDKDAVVRVVQRKPLPFMLTRMIREVDLNAG